MNAPPGAVLRAAENQDWTALRALLEPSRSADAKVFDFEEMLASTRADPAAATRRYFTGAMDAAAAAAVGSLEVASGSLEAAVSGGEVAEGPPADLELADADTGMTALHWIARHGTIAEADLIAPIAALLAAAHERSQGCAASSVGPPSAASGGAWLLDASGGGPLHHLAYNGHAAKDSSAAQELVSEVVRVTGCDVNGVDLLGNAPMHAAAATANSKVVLALLWIGADPYKEDGNDLAAAGVADLFGSLEVGVGLRAVAQKEPQLAASLATVDEAARGVERAAAFREAVAAHLEAPAAGPGEDASVVPTADHDAPPSVGEVSVATEAEQDEGDGGDDNFAIEPALASKGGPPPAAESSSSGLAEASGEFWADMAKQGGHGAAAAAIMADVHKLATSIAVLEAKVDNTSATRRETDRRLAGLSAGLEARSKAYRRASASWKGNDVAVEAEADSAAAAMAAALGTETRQFVTPLGQTLEVEVPNLAAAAAAFTKLSKDAASTAAAATAATAAATQEAGAKAVASHGGEGGWLGRGGLWESVVRRVSTTEVGAAMLADAGILETGAFVGSTTFGIDGRVEPDAFSKRSKAAAAAEAKAEERATAEAEAAALYASRRLEKPGRRNTTGGIEAEKTAAAARKAAREAVDAVRGGDFLTAAELQLRRELEGSAGRLWLRMLEREEGAHMAEEDYHSQVWRDEVDEARSVRLALLRPLGGFTKRRGNKGGGGAGETDDRADAAAEADDDDERAAEAQLLRRAALSAPGARAAPLAAELLQAPHVGLGLARHRPLDHAQGAAPAPTSAGAEALGPEAAAALVAAALEADYVSEKRALRSSLVNDVHFSRAHAAGHRASALAASVPRVGPSDRADRKPKGGALKRPVPQPAKGHDELALAEGGGGGSAVLALGDVLSGTGNAAAAAEAARGTLLSGGGLSTGSAAGLLPLALDRIRFAKTGTDLGDRPSTRLAPTFGDRGALASRPKQPAAVDARRGAISAVDAPAPAAVSGVSRSGLSISALSASLAAAAAIGARNPSLAVGGVAGEDLLGWGRSDKDGDKDPLGATLKGRKTRAEMAASAAAEATGEASAGRATAALEASVHGDNPLAGGSKAAQALVAAADPIQRLGKAARTVLKEHFDLYVPKKEEDPYSLAFLTKKRGLKRPDTITEKDLRLAVWSLGWHSLSDAEVAQYASVVRTAAEEKAELEVGDHDPLKAAAAAFEEAEVIAKAEAEKVAEAKKRKGAMSYQERKKQEAEAERLAEEKAKADAEAEAKRKAEMDVDSDEEVEKAIQAALADAEASEAKARELGVGSAVPVKRKAAVSSTRRFGERPDKKSFHANFTGFLTLLANKTAREAKLSERQLREFKEAFELFVEDDPADKATKGLVTVKAVECVMASLGHRMDQGEVAALVEAAVLGEAFRAVKRAEKGNDARARVVADEALEALLRRSRPTPWPPADALLVELPLALRVYGDRLKAEADHRAAKAAAKREAAEAAAALRAARGKVRAARRAARAEKEREGYSLEALYAQSLAQAAHLEAQAAAAAALAARHAEDAERRVRRAAGDKEVLTLAEEEVLAAAAAQAAVEARAKEEADRVEEARAALAAAEEEENDPYLDETEAALADAASRQEARFKKFIGHFEAGSEAAFVAATFDLKGKEQLRLQHAARALKPLLLELEEEAALERALAQRQAEAREQARRRAAAQLQADRDRDLPANASEVREKLAKQQARVREAATSGLGAMHGFLATAAKTAAARTAETAGFDASSILGAQDQASTNDDAGGDKGAAAAGRQDGGGDGSYSSGAQQTTGGGELGRGAEALLGDDGDVWDEVEGRWMSSEEAARREVARAQAWAEDVTRDHLKWYLAEFRSASYEEWIAAFAPENARDYLAGSSPDVDHRFYFPSATHLRLWNDAIGSGDPKGHHRLVAPRKTLPAAVMSI